MIVRACHRAAFQKVFAANATENRDRKPDEIRDFCSIWDLFWRSSTFVKENSSQKAVGDAKQVAKDAVNKAAAAANKNL
jgi:hypothetical protein